MTLYNFEELQNRFTSMTHTEILEEYAKIQREIQETEKLPIDSEEFHFYREPLDEASYYLGTYIALDCCAKHGIKVFL